MITNEVTKVVIAVARCSRSKECFGVRLEMVSHNNWVVNWAFPIKESLARKEGYDRSEITGQIQLSDSYPGCPYCNIKSIFKCSCGKIGCHHGETREVTCPWCNEKCRIEGEIDSLTISDDR